MSKRVLEVLVGGEVVEAREIPEGEWVLFELSPGTWDSEGDKRILRVRVVGA